MEFCYKSRAEAKKMKVGQPFVQPARHLDIHVGEPSLEKLRLPSVFMTES